MKLKTYFEAAMAAVGAMISYLFGGWDEALITLLIFMAVDYLTGIIVAGVFKNSPKTDSGSLESKAGFKGICRKGVMLLVVLVAFRLDCIMSTAYIKDAVVIAFVTNEAISIVENAGLMGVPIPKPIKNAIDILIKKETTEKNPSECQ